MITAGRRFLLAAAFLVAGIGGAAAEEQWLPVQEQSLEVAPGSPLDFSDILPNRPVNADNRLIIDNGRFVRADDLEQPERLLCASLAWSPASGGFPDHDEADRYARQLAMHGYNLARFTFVDSSLMQGRQADFDFDLAVLDRMHYLMAALKREGISWIMDGMTSARGALAGHDEDRWGGGGNLKRSVLLEPTGLDHWSTLQRRLLARINPYTGIAPLADPALALIVLVNEGGLEFDSLIAEGQGENAYSPAIVAGFNSWLRRHYADSGALERAWGWLEPGESLEAGTVAMPTGRYGPSPRYRDVQRYFVENEMAGTAAMSTILRNMGYRGAISNYNNWSSRQASLSRRNLDVVTMNTYFDWVGSYDPGAQIEQRSAIAEGLDYIGMAATTRWLGKPFLLTEYDHLFWNRHRYEAGLAMPAYAALQGWDGLCRHGHGPIVLRYGEDVPHKRAMLPYAIALDPVARAGETLAALLFRRGDVASTTVTIPFAIEGENGLTDRVGEGEPEELASLAALGAIGLTEGTGTGVPAARESTGFAAMVAQLVAAGTLHQDVAAAAERGEYLSDTGQIRLVPGKGLLQVTTPRTVAAAFERLEGELDLGPAVLRASSVPALFALSALDGADLVESRRILLILATDARNSGMHFADEEARQIVDFGHLPVLIRPGRVKFGLNGEGIWTISRVGLDGVVGPVLASGLGRIELELDNTTQDGPTTYFVIERG